MSLANSVANKIQMQDQAAHRWYRLVLSFPPHLVRDYLEKFGVSTNQCVLDPFCGTGTTLVECKKRNIKSIGIEAHPMMYFASQVKTDWSPDVFALKNHARTTAGVVLAALAEQNIEDLALFPQVTNVQQTVLRTLAEEQFMLLLKDSISPLPLHKVIMLRETLARQQQPAFSAHEYLALANALISSIGNVRFGPEVGIGKIKYDTEVVDSWLREISVIADDLSTLQRLASVESTILRADAREVSHYLAPNSIDVVFTSPPYPNEKDYTRTTRLETVLLDFIKTKKDLRTVKDMLLRSNTRNVFASDTDDKWIEPFPEIMDLAEKIERRRVELQKTSGFEKLYTRVTKLFFGGMVRHLADLRSVLRPGARLGYVVGDQASFFQIMIRTGYHIAQIAQALGYEVVSIDLFRTRIATATGSHLREEVVVLRWPG